MTKPFIKCVGGKTQWLEILDSAMPEGDVKGSYYEPFVGGGALLWHLWDTKRINHACIGDANRHLINCYNWMQKDPRRLHEFVESWMRTHGEEQYYRCREEMNGEAFSDESVVQAVYYMYLNRTCFNGLARFNQKGKFNSPIGRKANGDLYYAPPDLQEYLLNQEALNYTKVYNLPHTDSMEFAQESDFMYLDPPYHKTFTGYTRKGFGEEEQTDLRDRFAKLPCSAMLSNSDTPFIRELYKDFRIDTFENLRSVGAKKRKTVRDVLIRNY